MIYDITPVPAPRMTRADCRKPHRPCVSRYFAFQNEVKLKNVEFNSGDRVEFHIPMPKSWSKKKKEGMAYSPHTQTPDLDNLIKALLDSIHKDDAHIYSLTASKYWAYAGSIRIG